MKRERLERMKGQTKKNKKKRERKKVMARREKEFAHIAE